MFVFDSELAVDGGEDTLYLSEGEHTAQKRVTRIVAVRGLVHDATRLVGEGHTVVYAHGKIRILLLEDTAEFDDVSTSAQMAGLREVAVGEDVAAAQVDEVGARSELLGHLHYIVIGTCRERTCTEGEAVMLVGHGIEEPLDILLSANDAWQAQNLDGGIVRMDAHVHAVFLASGHDGLEEILHVLAQLGLVDALVEIEELAELLHGSLVVLAEVAADEALGLVSTKA